jgi:hypothetical protein
MTFEFPSAVPFVVGVGRCGTTLLRLMLDAHPNIAIPPETHFIPALADPGVNESSCEEFFRIVTSSPRWADFHLDKALFRSALEKLNPFSQSDGLRCFYSMYADRFGKRCWGDKTPSYSLHMTLIQSLMPEARFIHLIRDGRDVALSYRGLWFGPGNSGNVGV